MQIRQAIERERNLARIPVRVPSGEIATLAPGGQNALIKQVIEEFCPRFTPGATVVYIGDAESKFLHFEATYLEGLGVVIAPSAKMPDVVVHDTRRNWTGAITGFDLRGPVLASGLLSPGMTANRVSLANLARYHRQEWITLARHTVAIVVAFWFLVKVVPVFADVRVSLGDNGFDSAAFFNTVSHIATLCGIWLLPLCLVARIAAGIFPECGGGEQWRRRGKLAFNGFLVGAILLPIVGFAIPLLRFWIASSP